MRPGWITRLVPSSIAPVDRVITGVGIAIGPDGWVGYIPPIWLDEPSENACRNSGRADR